MSIHPTAVISDSTELADNVTIGPYAVIEGKVQIDSGTTIGAHAIVGNKNGITKIGKNNQIFSHAYVGGAPQDKTYKNEETRLEIGDNNLFREFVTVNMGTLKEDGVTKIGSDCMLMAYVHIAHDCKIGDRVIIANTTNFAGHVTVENDVHIGGACNFSQFIRLGKFSFIAGDTTCNKDILPFTIAEGKWALSRATNKIGLERSGLEKSQVENIHKGVRALIKGDRTLDEALEKIKQDCQEDENIKYLLNFIETTKKGLAR